MVEYILVFYTLSYKLVSRFNVLYTVKPQQLVGEIVVTENMRLEQIGTAVEELQTIVL